MTRALKVRLGYAVLSCLMVMYFAGVMVYAQTHSHTEIDSRVGELERRANNSDNIQTAEHLVERIARLEATTDINNKLLIAVFGAVVIMLLEKVAAVVGRRKEPPE